MAAICLFTPYGGYLPFKEDGEPDRPPRGLDFGGDNGTRLTFDWSCQTRWRLFFGVQLHDKGRAAIVTHNRLGRDPSPGWDYDRDFQERISRDIRVVTDSHPPGIVTGKMAGQMRAVFEHGERLQREADQEAENQRSGDYKTVIFEPLPTKPDVVAYKGGKRSSLRGKTARFASLQERIDGKEDDDTPRTIEDTIADGSHTEQIEAEDRAEMVRDATDGGQSKPAGTGCP
jgi:hypothetical protein